VSKALNGELMELGRRAVACDGWRWKEGMLAVAKSHPTLPGYRLCWVEGAVGGGSNGDKTWSLRNDAMDPMDLSEWLPDLSDAATRGCILALVPVVHGWVNAESLVVALEST